MRMKDDFTVGLLEFVKINVFVNIAKAYILHCFEMLSWVLVIY